MNWPGGEPGWGRQGELLVRWLELDGFVGPDGLSLGHRLPPQLSYLKYSKHEHFCSLWNFIPWDTVVTLSILALKKHRQIISSPCPVQGRILILASKHYYTTSAFENYIFPSWGNGTSTVFFCLFSPYSTFSFSFQLSLIVLCPSPPFGFGSGSGFLNIFLNWHKFNKLSKNESLTCPILR